MSPLVTIGIPTYNRAATLGRAIESALSQDHANLELIISDNASTDDTQALCLGYAERDPRVRYLRSPVNEGPIANFGRIADAATGKYLLWLGDDDWLDRDYLSECVKVLEQRPDHALVYGNTKYYRGTNVDFEQAGFSMQQRTGAARVLAYFLRVRRNAAFYGVIRRDVIDTLPPIKNVYGADWLFVASVAFAGKVRAIPSTTIHRALGGASASPEQTASTLGLSRFQGRLPYLMIAGQVLREVGWASPVYAPLGRSRRLLLAAQCQPPILLRQLALAGGLMKRPDGTRPLVTFMRRSRRTIT